MIVTDWIGRVRFIVGFSMLVQAFTLIGPAWSSPSSVSDEVLLAMPPDKFKKWCDAQLDTDYPIKTAPTRFDRIVRERMERNLFTTDDSCFDLIGYGELYEEGKFDATSKTPSRSEDYYPRVTDIVRFLQRNMITAVPHWPEDCGSC